MVTRSVAKVTPRGSLKSECCQSANEVIHQNLDNTSSEWSRCRAFIQNLGCQAAWCPHGPCDQDCSHRLLALWPFLVTCLEPHDFFFSVSSLSLCFLPMSTWLPSALLALFSAPAALALSLAEPDRTQPVHSLILLSLAASDKTPA